MVRRERKRQLDSVGWCVPDRVLDRAREKRLARLATRGVVQLFNAVGEQQKKLRYRISQDYIAFKRFT